MRKSNVAPDDLSHYDDLAPEPGASDPDALDATAADTVASSLSGGTPRLLASERRWAEQQAKDDWARFKAKQEVQMRRVRISNPVRLGPGRKRCLSLSYLPEAIAPIPQTSLTDTDWESLFLQVGFTSEEAQCAYYLKVASCPTSVAIQLLGWTRQHWEATRKRVERRWATVEPQLLQLEDASNVRKILQDSLEFGERMRKGLQQTSAKCNTRRLSAQLGADKREARLDKKKQRQAKLLSIKATTPNDATS